MSDHGDVNVVLMVSNVDHQTNITDLALCPWTEWPYGQISSGYSINPWINQYFLVKDNMCPGGYSYDFQLGS